MKKIICSLAVISVFILSASASFARGNMDNGFGKSDMKATLSLTDEQQDKMFKLNQDYRQKMYDNRKDPVKLSDLRAEKFKAMYAILTKEQQEKFNTLHKEGSGKKGNRKGDCR